MLHKASIRHLDVWLSFSPNHFYVDDDSRLDARTPLESLEICKPCMVRRTRDVSGMLVFSRELRQKPIRVFDPFAGVGAFGAGMALGFPSCSFVNTHAIEISPSAAATLKCVPFLSSSVPRSSSPSSRKNSPETTVYNQCANTVLKKALELERSHSDSTPLQDIRETVELPDPPKPGDVDCLIAGFPW